MLVQGNNLWVYFRSLAVAVISTGVRHLPVQTGNSAESIHIMV